MSDFVVKCISCGRTYDSRDNVGCPKCMGLQQELELEPKSTPVKRSAISPAAAVLAGIKPRKR